MRLAVRLVMTLALCGPATAAERVVEVVQGGQFYHRPGHLVVDEPATVPLARAIADGYAACPECASAGYFQALVAGRRAGTLFDGIRPAKTAGGPTVGPPAVLATPVDVPAPRAVAPAFDLPADGIPVPGTGGLLKVPTFKGSGGIVAVPLPYGGYTVVEPPFTTGPAARPASDPAPSAR